MTPVTFKLCGRQQSMEGLDGSKHGRLKPVHDVYLTWPDLSLTVWPKSSRTMWNNLVNDVGICRPPSSCLPFLLSGDNDVLVYRFPFHKRPQQSLAEPALCRPLHPTSLSVPARRGNVETCRQAIDAKQSTRVVCRSVAGMLGWLIKRFTDDATSWRHACASRYLRGSQRLGSSCTGPSARQTVDQHDLSCSAAFVPVYPNRSRLQGYITDVWTNEAVD